MNQATFLSIGSSESATGFVQIEAKNGEAMQAYAN
jgi:hypothetical protein